MRLQATRRLLPIIWPVRILIGFFSVHSKITVTVGIGALRVHAQKNGSPVINVIIVMILTIISCRRSGIYRCSLRHK